MKQTQSGEPSTTLWKVWWYCTICGNPCKVAQPPKADDVEKIVDWRTEFDKKFYQKGRVWISIGGESYGSESPEMGRGELFRFIEAHGKAEREDEMKNWAMKVIRQGEQSYKVGYTKGIEAAIAAVKKESGMLDEILTPNEGKAIVELLESLKQTP